MSSTGDFNFNSKRCSSIATNVAWQNLKDFLLCMRATYTDWCCRCPCSCAIHCSLLPLMHMKNDNQKMQSDEEPSPINGEIQNCLLLVCWYRTVLVLIGNSQCFEMLESIALYFGASVMGFKSCAFSKWLCEYAWQHWLNYIMQMLIFTATIATAILLFGLKARSSIPTSLLAFMLLMWTVSLVLALLVQALIPLGYPQDNLRRLFPDAMDVLDQQKRLGHRQENNITLHHPEFFRSAARQIYLGRAIVLASLLRMGSHPSLKMLHLKKICLIDVLSLSRNFIQALTKAARGEHFLVKHIILLLCQSCTFKGQSSQEESSKFFCKCAFPLLQSDTRHFQMLRAALLAVFSCQALVLAFAMRLTVSGSAVKGYSPHLGGNRKKIKMQGIQDTYAEQAARFLGNCMPALGSNRKRPSMQVRPSLAWEWPSQHYDPHLQYSGEWFLTANARNLLPCRAERLNEFYLEGKIILGLSNKEHICFSICTFLEDGIEVAHVCTPNAQMLDLKLTLHLLGKLQTIPSVKYWAYRAWLVWEWRSSTMRGCNGYRLQQME